MAKTEKPEPPGQPALEQRNHTPAAPQGNHRPETGQGDSKPTPPVDN